MIAVYSAAPVPSSLELWVAAKCDIARRLDAGGIGGGYAEAVLVIGATLSTLAAVVWPGEKIDRMRFAELWTMFMPREDRSHRLSVPLLVAELEHVGLNEAAEKLRDAAQHAYSFGQLTRVVTGDDVDLAESDVLATCGNIERRMLRRCSYADVFYRHVRSAFVHEFRASSHAASVPMAPAGAGVSYVNQLGAVHRLIHFEITWLAHIASALSSAVAELETPRPIPDGWWLNGA